MVSGIQLLTIISSPAIGVRSNDSFAKTDTATNVRFMTNVLSPRFTIRLYLPSAIAPTAGTLNEAVQPLMDLVGTSTFTSDTPEASETGRRNKDVESELTIKLPEIFTVVPINTALGSV